MNADAAHGLSCPIDADLAWRLRLPKSGLEIPADLPIVPADTPALQQLEAAAAPAETAPAAIENKPAAGEAAVNKAAVDVPATSGRWGQVFGSSSSMPPVVVVVP